jgi:hypothetical protein
MRANRIYLRALFERFIPEEILKKIEFEPGTDDKYIEYPYARITLNDNLKKSCSVDWQRANEQWVTIYTGTWQNA